MLYRCVARAAALVLFLLPLTGVAGAEDAPKTGNAVIDRAVEIVDKDFYTTAPLEQFHAAVQALIDRGKTSDQPFVLDDAVNGLLASLGASHTGRYTADQVDYYELSDVFRYGMRRELRRLYPPDGEVAYDGIGIASQTIDGKRFVTDVYDGAPAALAGVQAGDEILSADGAPFAEIGSFRGKAGETVDLELRRTADGAPVTVPGKVVRSQPLDTYVAAINGSARVISRDGKSIGVVHLWAWTSGRMTDLLNQLLATKFKDVDGLVLDLRSRWGGAPADAGELFVGRTADMTVKSRDRDVQYVNTRFHKPIVAIIDAGTRSGMEILAYSLKKNGIPLVGTPTAGDVLAATAYPLPDDSLLELAVEDVHVDGKRLEANPVTPDITVPRDIRYANGADPQMDAALGEMDRRLEKGVD
jgi:C-terminal processing protease CtpA/Prc